MVQVEICKVLFTDILDVKLQKAKEVGADYTIKIERNMTEQDIIKKVKELLGEEPTISFDATGVEQCVRVALQVSALTIAIAS